MDIEKELLVAAPAQQVWQMLLDLNVMGACVPGMQSINVISDVEYVSVIHVKIAFISAKFKIKTTIVEQRAPHYLRTEGTGEDASVASSLKQSSEIFLSQREDGQTELRMKIHVDVLGRLGTFGLSVMKTKADRMWEEFAQNLAARLVPVAAEAAEPASTPESMSVSAAPTAMSVKDSATPLSTPVPVVPLAPSQRLPTSWWTRVFASLSRAPSAAQAPAWPHIRVDLKRGDTAMTVYWPLEAAQQCTDWLRSSVD
jgi:uncharacterized protein